MSDQATSDPTFDQAPDQVTTKRGRRKPRSQVNPNIDPIELDIEVAAPPPIEDRDAYWCGALDDCPASVALGGFEFPIWSGRVVTPPDAKSRAQHFDRTDRGVVHRMTEADVKKVLENAANRVVRGRDILSKSGSHRRPYRAQPDDIPLGCFVYMAKVTGHVDRMGDVRLPPPMVPRER